VRLIGTMIVGGGLSCLVCLYVMVHEWTYRNHHRYAPGPSGYIAALAAAGAVLALCITWDGIQRYNEKKEADRRWLEEMREQARKREEAGIPWAGDNSEIES
jgi:hypothetical protein